MSRATNIEIVNPAEKFYSWDATKGIFKNYNKESKENEETKLPFTFLVLDTLNTCKGYSDKDQSGYWSNEVRDTNTDILTVHTSKGVIAKDLYAAVKANPNCIGLKYSQSVYIGLLKDNELSLSNIQFTGAALSSWITFRKEHGNSLFKGAIEVAKSTTGKKGATVYQIPLFNKKEVSEEIDAKAKELDKILQEYLTLYLERNSKN